MLPKWTLVLCAVITTTLSADPVFQPGCSFLGGQCVYEIKLGHSNQCDKQPVAAATSSSGGGCCDDLSTKYSQLKDDMDKLNIKVDVMTSVIGDSSKNMSETESELAKALTARDDIVMVLNRKESELNSTKAELAKVMANAAKEIQNLRNTLISTQSSVSTCQAALGGVDSTVTPDSKLGYPSGDYSMTYFDFNTPPKDFTFTTISNRQQIHLMTHGSSFTTGPRVEHTWGISKGAYLGIDSQGIAKATSSSSYSPLRAESGTFPPANAYCIMFWYYMEGRDVKTLTTNVKINGGTGYPVWSKTGPNSSHKWELAQIELDSEYTQYQFQIEFDMKSGAHYDSHSYHSGHYTMLGTEGDIAMDDLYVYNTTCSNIPRHPQGVSFYKDNVTSFYTFHFTPMTWTEAYDVCRREGPWSALVSIESMEEQQALVKIIRSNAAYSVIGAKGFYTSGNDMDKERAFTWTNTGVPDDITLDYWHTGQPNNVAGNQDCLLMEYPNDDYRWGDVDCDTKHPFICEVELPGKVN